jgi:hypothetical protein
MTLSRSSIISKFSGSLSLLIIIPILLLLVSCTEAPEDPPPFKPTSTINKLFIVGSQVDNGDLVLYVNGTDADGTPFTETDLQSMDVVVGDEPTTVTYTHGDGNVSVNAVVDGSKLLSLTFLSDYSGSIPDAEFAVLSSIHNLILDALPNIYELQVINFSRSPEPIRLDWTESNSDVNSADYIAIRNAVELDASIDNQDTALYDSIGFALERDLSILDDGLIERCRPARMLIAFSDGVDNFSSQYTDLGTLADMIKRNNVLTIMLGSKNADLSILSSLAGDKGAIVQMSNATDIEAQITNWKDSLSGMVSVRITPNTTETITLRMPSGQEVVYVLASGGVCP